MTEFRTHNAFLASTIAALMALGFSSEALSQNTLPPVYVIGPSPIGGGGFRGGGGGGGWGGASSTGQDYGYEVDVCGSIQGAAVSLGCDLKNPPLLAPGGCGSRDSEWVPDGVPGYPGLFTRACFAHDVCYGTLGSSKDSCDVQLGNDLAVRCSAIDPSDWGARGLCTAAASGYPAALRRLSDAHEAFRRAQQEAQCRDLARQAEANVCP